MEIFLQLSILFLLVVPTVHTTEKARSCQGISKEDSPTCCSQDEEFCIRYLPCLYLPGSNNYYHPAVYVLVKGSAFVLTNSKQDITYDGSKYSSTFQTGNDLVNVTLYLNSSTKVSGLFLQRSNSCDVWSQMDGRTRKEFLVAVIATPSICLLLFALQIAFLRISGYDKDEDPGRAFDHFFTFSTYGASIVDYKPRSRSVLSFKTKLTFGGLTHSSAKKDLPDVTASYDNPSMLK